MTGWIIAGVVVLVLLGILLPRIYIVLEAGEELCVKLRLFRLITIRILPTKPKKPKPLSAKAMQRQEEKRKRKLQKEQKRATKKEKKGTEAQAPAEKPGKMSVPEILELATDVLGAFLRRFAKFLRLDVTRIRIKVATSDAAQTAILYGVVCQSLQFLLTLLDQITNVKTTRQTDIDVSADFLSETMQFELKIAVSISPMQVIRLGITALWHYITCRHRQKKARSASQHEK